MNLVNKVYQGKKEGKEFCNYCRNFDNGYCKYLKQSVYIDNRCVFYIEDKR